MPRKVEITKENKTLTDEVVYEKSVTKFGSSSKNRRPKKVHWQKSLRHNPQKTKRLMSQSR
jgi:putative transposon-encoded protein